MGQNHQVFWDKLRTTVAADPAAPLVTWLGGPGRIELSRRTFGAAVVKAANLLGSELEVEVGTRVSVSLGNHWQSCVWHAAVLVSGGTLADEGADLHVVPVGSQAAGRTAVVSLDPFGMPPREVPPGVVNAAADVRAMPDQLAIAPGQGDVALDCREGRLTLAALEDLAATTDNGPVAIHGTGSVLERALWHAAVPAVRGTPIVLGDAMTDEALAHERIAATVRLVG